MAAPVCTKLLLILGPAYKRACRPLGILISSFPLFAFGRSGRAEERGPAGVQVGTGGNQVSTANLFTLYPYLRESALFSGLVFGFPKRNAV
jgi:hypothetical protein